MLGHPSLLALGIFDNTMAGFGGHCALGGGLACIRGAALDHGHELFQVFNVINGCLWLGKNFASGGHYLFMG